MIYGQLRIIITKVIKVMTLQHHQTILLECGKILGLSREIKQTRKDIIGI